jgi:hypothetical protein
MKLSFFAVLLLVAFPVFAQEKTAPGTDDDILHLARTFWVDLNLGDFEKFSALGRPEDSSVIPAPKENEAAGMLKMKDLPQLAGLRKEISDETAKAFTFSQPIIAADGKSAKVTVTQITSETRSLRELKMIYDVYMAAAYEASQAGKDPPTLESIRVQVLAPDSPAQKRIDGSTTELEKMKLPPLVFEKTAQGWRLNLKDILGQ